MCLKYTQLSKLTSVAPGSNRHGMLQVIHQRFTNIHMVNYCLTLFSWYLWGEGQLLDHNSLSEHLKAVVSSRILQHVNWLKVNKT